MPSEENLKKGFCKLFRSFIEWQWFTDVNVAHVFLYCLLRANYADAEWRGIKIKKGSFVTSLEKLAEATGLTIRKVRRALDKLELTNSLTRETTTKYTVITIVNWDTYQQYDIETDKQKTRKRQTRSKRTTTNKKKKEEKEYIVLGEFQNVYLTQEELTKLQNLYGNNFNNAIEMLSTYIAKFGKKYKSHYAAMKEGDWVYKKVMEEIQDKVQGIKSNASTFVPTDFDKKMIEEGRERD